MKLGVDLVDEKLGKYKYVIIPTEQIGVLEKSLNGKGEIREDSVKMTITDIFEMVYADRVFVDLPQVDFFEKEK